MKERKDVVGVIREGRNSGSNKPIEHGKGKAATMGERKKGERTT